MVNRGGGGGVKEYFQNSGGVKKIQGGLDPG